MRFWAVAAAAMVAVLWPMFWSINKPLHPSAIHELVLAAIYSIGFSSMSALFSRTRLRRERFAKWAAKHPEPVATAALGAPSVATRAPVVPRGRARVAWIGWTLVVAFGSYWFLGFFITAATGFRSGGSAVIAIVAAAGALPVAAFLRLYWPPVRDWNARN